MSSNQLMFNLYCDDEEVCATEEQEETKICNKCGLDLPVSEFSFHSASNYLRPECKKCNNILSKERKRLRDENPPPDEGHVCPICKRSGKECAGEGNSKNGPWALDHCHSTKEFRGWLCHKCNRAIGCFNDNKELLLSALKYLEG